MKSLFFTANMSGIYSTKTVYNLYDNDFCSSSILHLFFTLEYSASIHWLNITEVNLWTFSSYSFQLLWRNANWTSENIPVDYFTAWWSCQTSWISEIFSCHICILWIDWEDIEFSSCWFYFELNEVQCYYFVFKIL